MATKIPIVCVYTKSKRANAKKYIKVFRNILVDDLVTTSKRKPLLPYEYEILEIGMGESFYDVYKKKHKI
jgi:hypothetical protein